MSRFYRSLCFAAVALRYVSAEEEAAAASEEPEMTQLVGGEEFAAFTSENANVLVKFMAPWCGHCKAMKSDFIAAAEELKADGVVLRDVDATKDENSEMATKEQIQGFPTIILYSDNGKRKSEYQGHQRTKDAIVAWVREKLGPAVATVEDGGEAAKTSRKWTEALYIVKGDEKIKELAEGVAKGTEIPQAKWVYAGAAETPSVAVFKGVSETAESTEVFGDAEALTTWAKSERQPMFGQIGEDNFEIYMESAKNGLFWVCFDPKDSDAQVAKYASKMVDAASKQGETKYPFVWLNTAEFEEHAKEELGCKDFPTIVLQRGDLLSEAEDAKVEKFVRSFAAEPAKLDETAVSSFFADIESGALKPEEQPDGLDELDEDEDEAAEEKDEQADEQEL